MAETRFIKTVAFGGYDKTDVDRRLDYLYSQVYELKNELRETKLTLDEYRKGTEEEKAHDTILAAERAKLTNQQVQNESLNQKLKEMREDNKAKEKKIEELSKSSEELKKNLKDANEKLENLQSGNDAAALSNVFIEAQKTANMLVEEATVKADKMDADSKKLVENMVAEANNKAAKIVYEAEKQAAEIDARSKTEAEEMKAASQNLKALMLSDIKDIGEQISKLKEVFQSLEKSGLEKLDKSGKLLEQTENKLNNGGVPVFKNPEKIQPELPDEPEYEQVDYNYSADSEEKKKKNDDLEKLMAMASALDGGSDDKDKKSKKKKDDNAVDLASLAAQAEALSGGKKADKNDSKKGGMDLDALLKQAESLDGN